jgi:beta-glucosidase
MPQDVALIKEMGLQAYSFSISWTRVLPDGRGALNQKGLDFYDQLVDTLLAADIVPVVTLNHWDFPQALQEVGGWPERDSVDWFVDYARTVFDRLGDRVASWITHNEPWVIAFLGYATGLHAPGMCDYSLAYQAAHHLLLSHGKTVQIFRQGGYRGEIGIVLSLEGFKPASENEADRAACQRVYQENFDLYLDPLINGHYPEMLFEWIGPHQPTLQAGDLDLISQPMDFLGVDHYRTHAVSHSVAGSLLKAELASVSNPGWGLTETGWGVTPAGLTKVLLDVKERCGDLKVYVAENGCAFPDTPDEDGTVADWGRVDYLRAHLQAALDAIKAGVNLQGYFVWSLMDNFEWAMGYGPRFGLIYVDYETGKRIPKQSAFWYSEVIKQNGINI